MIWFVHYLKMGRFKFAEIRFGINSKIIGYCVRTRQKTWKRADPTVSKIPPTWLLFPKTWFCPGKQIWALKRWNHWGHFRLRIWFLRSLLTETLFGNPTASTENPRTITAKATFLRGTTWKEVSKFRILKWKITNNWKINFYPMKTSQQGKVPWKGKKTN